MAETLSTLRFADQAKRIKNQAVVNEDTDGDKAALKREIKRLAEELAAAKRAAATAQQLSLSGGFAPGALAAAAGSGGEAGTGTPARLQAQADALLSATSPAMEVRLGSWGNGTLRRSALLASFSYCML